MDYNGDGEITFADLTAIAQYYGTTQPFAPSGVTYMGSSATPGTGLGIVPVGISPQYFYYSSQWQIIQEVILNNVAGTTQTLNQYVWGIANVNELVLRDSNADGSTSTGNYGISGSGLEQRLYALQDANYNVIALMGLVSSTWSVVERFVYDPYGSVTALNASGQQTTEPYSWVYLYQGGRLDGVTGLYEFQHRDYSPGDGRWMEQDPAGYVDGANLYQAMGSNPVNHTDIQGLCSDDENDESDVYPTGNMDAGEDAHPGQIFMRNPGSPDPNNGFYYTPNPPNTFQNQMQQQMQSIQQGLSDVQSQLTQQENQLSVELNALESLNEEEVYLITDLRQAQLGLAINAITTAGATVGAPLIGKAVGLAVDGITSLFTDAAENAPELLGRDGVDIGETIGENQYPQNPGDLLDRGYVDVSDPNAAANGHFTYENPETGDMVRFDEGTPGEPGYSGVDHYHQSNPNATGNSDMYLDANGNPVAKGSKASHILPGDGPG